MSLRSDENDQVWDTQMEEIEALVDRGTKLVKEHFKPGEEMENVKEGLEAVLKRMKQLEKSRTQQQMAIQKVREQLRSGSAGGYQEVDINKMYNEALKGNQ